MERILGFQLNDVQCIQVKQIAFTLKAKFIRIEETDYRQQIGDLAEDKRSALVETFAGDAPKESMLVICGFTDAKLDQLLASLRRQQSGIDYKAVLTETNRQWNVLRLYAEMEREREVYRRAQQ